MQPHIYAFRAAHARLVAADAGMDVSDCVLAALLLLSVPESYEAVTTALHGLDVDALTFAAVSRALLQEEQQRLHLTRSLTRPRRI